MKLSSISILSSLAFFIACQNSRPLPSQTFISEGQMPELARDRNGNIHLVYGKGDSIWYAWSEDAGLTFSTPSVLASVPKLAASHTRGPQIAATADGLVVTACTQPGDIFSFSKRPSGEWIPGGRVNDQDTTAKENLMSLAADGHRAYAVWLDLRDGHNKIVGSSTVDGGRTWTSNKTIYASPDTTVCECCKPSVAIKGEKVYVMFRNWLNGNRDLYLIRSENGGEHFSEAEKLGQGNWALNGCPMDGGGLALNDSGVPVTVWRRKGMIYSCVPGNEEMEVAPGKGAGIEMVNGKPCYVLTEDGHVVVLTTDGIKKVIGKGQMPVLQGVDKNRVLCVWENEKKIYSSIVDL